MDLYGMLDGGDGRGGGGDGRGGDGGNQGDGQQGGYRDNQGSNFIIYLTIKRSFFLDAPQVFE